MSLPLRGTVIVEAVSLRCPLALRLAIAFAGRLVADLGATVVQARGDAAAAPQPGDSCAEATDPIPAFLNAGKRLLGAPQGHGGDAWHSLLRQSAAVISDQQTVAASALPHQPPLQVVLSMFGDGIPATTPASEFTVMAMGGLLDIVGDADRQPLMLGGHQLAYSAGLSAFTGLMSVLGPATVAPVLQTIRVNLLDTAVWLNWKSLVAAAQSGTAPTRAGNTSEWRVVPCADGWLALVYRDTDWPRLKQLVDDPRLEAPCFDTQAGRRENAGELEKIMQTAFLKMRRRQIHVAALANRLPLGPVYSPQELVQDRQNVARGFLRSVSLGPARAMLIPRLPVLWNGQAFEPGAPPMTIGPTSMVGVQ